MKLLSPIVGAYFRPPSTTLLHWLPSGTPLILSPEPSNPHDSNAIAVYLSLFEISRLIGNLSAGRLQELDDELAKSGWSIDRLDEDSGPFHLGYLPASLRTARGYATNTQILPLLFPPQHSSVLAFAPDGTPLVEVSQ